MRIGRWPLVLFVAVAVPLSVSGDLDGIVGVALLLAIVADTYISVSYYPPGVAGVYFVSNGLLGIAAVRCLVGSLDPFVRRFDDTGVALVLGSRTLAFMCTFYWLSSSTHATVVRTYAYCTLMYVAQILAILQLRQLVALLATWATVEETTRAPCVVHDSPGATGYLFAQSPFVATCPTRVWEHIRINSLFVSQVYVLYTLTTDMAYDAAGSSAYAVGMLAALECIALSIAVGVQFDVIAGCHTVSWGVGALLLVTAVAHAVRRMYSYRTARYAVADCSKLTPCATAPYAKLKL